MKKLLLFVTVAFSVNTYAQGIQFGAKAGLNYNILSDGDESISGVGYHLGAIIDFEVFDKSGFRVELLGSSRNIKSTFETPIFTYVTKYKPFYLTVPVLFNYNGIGKMSLMAGPQLSFLLANKFSTKIGDSDPTVIKGSDAKDGLRSMEFGIALGVEYDLSDQLGLGFRYVRGLQSFVDSNNSDERYNVLQLGLTYKM